MKLLYKVTIVIVLFFSGSFALVFSQENQVTKTTLDYYISNFSAKGVMADASEIQNLSHEDLIRIDNFNFNQYRKLNVDQFIELDGNQKMTLKSLNYLVNSGIQVDESLLSLKLNEIDESGLKPVIVKVIINLGYQKVDSNEFWEAR